MDPAPSIPWVFPGCARTLPSQIPTQRMSRGRFIFLNYSLISLINHLIFIVLSSQITYNHIILFQGLLVRTALSSGPQPLKTLDRSRTSCRSWRNIRGQTKTQNRMSERSLLSMFLNTLTVVMCKSSFWLLLGLLLRSPGHILINLIVCNGRVLIIAYNVFVKVINW